MKKWLLSLLLLSFPFALEVNVTPATKLVKDRAYIISAIGLSGSNTVDYISGDSTITEGGTYKLAPQVIVYDGTTKFVGTATNFTGCFNDIKYVDSRPSGGCGIIKVENITSENIKAGVTVSYGLENNTLTSITGTFTSDANAYASGILSGLSAYVNGSKITGTMANRGAVSQSLNAGGSYTIPAGYHNGSGKVTANSLSSQTSATATAANILKDKTAWVNGSKITGTMTNQGAVSSYLNPGNSYTIPAGYHNGSGTVTANYDGNLAAGNIRSGVSIFGITGNYTGGVSSETRLQDPNSGSNWGSYYGVDRSFNSNYKMVICVMSLGGGGRDGEYIDRSRAVRGFDGSYLTGAYSDDDRVLGHLIAWKFNYTAGSTLQMYGGYNTVTTCHGFN